MSDFPQIKELLNKNANANWYMCRHGAALGSTRFSYPDELFYIVKFPITAFCTAHDGKPLIVKFEATTQDIQDKYYQEALEVYHGEKFLTHFSEEGPYVLIREKPKKLQMNAAFNFMKERIVSQKSFKQTPEGTSGGIPFQLAL